MLVSTATRSRSYRIWRTMPPLSYIPPHHRKPPPVIDQNNTKQKGQVYHRGSLDSTPLGQVRVAFQAIQNQRLPGAGTGTPSKQYAKHLSAGVHTKVAFGTAHRTSYLIPR